MVLPLVTIEGRVVEDPELRFAPSGMAVAKVRLVADQKKKTESGEWVDDKVLWITATCFRQLAENMVESIVKGDLVTVVGRLQTDSWETENGEKRSVVTVVANSVAASLAFRTVPHGGGRADRPQQGAQQGAQQGQNDPWATGAGQGGQRPQQRPQQAQQGAARGAGQGGQQSQDPWASGGFNDEPPF